MGDRRTRDPLAPVVEIKAAVFPWHFCHVLLHENTPHESIETVEPLIIKGFLVVFGGFHSQGLNL